MQFKEWLLTTEMFDSSVPIRWIKKTAMDWEGDFLVNGKQYIIKMMNEPMMGWEVKFELLRNGKYTQDITGTGDAATVFATVMGGIRKWMAEVKPSSFALTAREPSRYKLYSRLLSMLPKKWRVEDMGGTFFVQDKTAKQPAFSGFSDSDFDDYYYDD